ncbi:MAG TPA: ZIP family zinc transporter [Patescibacteria group bacterium]|nr:ZIP family zinc transporter [Patescibacteria group bacterium]
MIIAFLWGLLAASSLLLGDISATYLKIPKRVLGLIIAFGVGVLISAVSFELVENAFLSTNRGWSVAGGLLAGALVFFVGDVVIERMGGRHHRKGKQGPGLAILLGTILDGIPESIVLGLTLVRGGSISIAMLVAVFLSNLPEAIGATAGLRSIGWRRNRTLGLWLIVTVISGLAALAGYAFFDTASPDVLAFTMAFAAGALLTMLADSMMPEAYRDSGRLGGLITTLGFGLAYFITALK